MVAQNVFHTGLSHQMRDLWRFADRYNIPWNLPTNFQTWFQQYSRRAFLYSAHCSCGNPMSFWSVWCRRTMIPGKIFTSFAKFEGIVCETATVESWLSHTTKSRQTGTQHPRRNISLTRNRTKKDCEECQVETVKSRCPEMTRQPRHCIDSKTLYHTEQKFQPPGDQLVTIIHDEYTTHSRTWCYSVSSLSQTNQKYDGGTNSCAPRNLVLALNAEMLLREMVTLLFDDD